MTRIVKNKEKSIKNKLQNFAQVNKLDFNLLATRYLQERLLFRLSNSKYKNSFCLKGGVLLYYLEKFAVRPTIDIDFMAIQINNDKQELKDIFTEIVSFSEFDDGVYFSNTEISAEEIQKEGEYKGIRVKIPSRIDTFKTNLQIDIGFGDKVYPKPVEIEYPIILKSEQPKILAYSNESVIAEKFQAMISLSEFNSRMKDFYDIYTIFNKHSINADNLRNALNLTFKTRQTSFDKNHIIFQEEFHTNTDRLKQWKAFLNKAGLDKGLEFKTVVENILKNITPYLQYIENYNSK